MCIRDSTVADQASRDLLYRLRLIGDQFTAEQVREVSDVSPVIESPMEKLADLLGLWVQQDTTSGFVVSPLVLGFDGSHMHNELVERVHGAIAAGIMGRIIKNHRLGPEEASQAIIHFVAARDLNQSAAVLAFALQALTELRQLVDRSSLSAI